MEYPPTAGPSEPKRALSEEESEEEEAPKKRRRRQALSCTECKRRKIKCDRQHPCGPCVRRSEADKCHWSVVEPADKYVLRTEWDALLRRVEALEGRDRIQSGLSLPGPRSLMSEDSHISRLLPPPLPSRTSSTAFSDRRPSEPFKYDKLDKPFDPKHDDDPRVFLAFPMAHAPTERAALLATVLAKSDAALDAGAVPSRAICDKIVDYYFKRVAWNHNFIDPEAFYDAYSAFFSSPLDTRHAPFIALLLALLCVGLENMTPQRVIRENICTDLAHWRRRCDAYWRAAQRALAANDVARNKPIELPQTLLMLLYANQSLDSNGWEYSSHLVAFAVRIAHSTGLSKLGSEPQGQIPPPGLRKRELGRRVWWNIVFLDWYLSPTVAHSYLVHPAQCTTDFPANLDWEEMRDGFRFEPKDRSQWTGASFLIAKAGLAESVRELSDHINAGQSLTYEFLLAYEQRVNERLGHIASALLRRDHVLERDDRVAWERVMFTIGFNNRVIRLHRRYMLRGYATLEYRASTEKCVAAAKNILNTYQEAQSLDFPGVTWWVVCMHAFAAAVILLMDQFYARTAVEGDVPAPAEMETRRRQICQAIQLLWAVAEINELGRRGAHVLSILLDELDRRRGPYAPPDTHPSLYTSLHPSAVGRLVLPPPHSVDAHLGSWVSAGLGPASVPDRELQSAPVSVRGLCPEVETFWTRVFELDFPTEP
ncbi:transcriptional regulatory protein [Ceratobasidium theobromae]|uniref:Transcriptional regulatory protein n=1 Tax=Ceratobasidium theobromae TaxID=1582974 RepID=A0A5N5QQT5_9AGAM|nr:transcriptional regulatory protein [Ceratobasidium theobromae]